MSWITITWSMMSACCLMLAATHGLIWCMKRTEWTNLLFAVTTAATAVFALCELWMMRVTTPAELANAIRWAHVPLWVLIVSLVAFMRLYTRAGRWWLAGTAVTLRTLALVLNFSTGQNLNYSEISAVRHIPLLGDSFAVASGVPNPCSMIAHLGSLMLLIFVADAGFTIWRRGDPQKALLVCGSVVFFILAGQVQAILVFWAGVQVPITITLFYLGIIGSMGFELSRDMLRSAKLSHDLRESRERMSLAAESADLGVWVWNITRDEIWMTPRCRSMFDFNPDDRLTVASFLVRVHPDDREAAERILRQSAVEKASYEVQHRLSLANGGERWVIVAGRVDSGVPGEDSRMHGICRDITERRREQQETLQLRQEIAHVGRISMMGQFASALAHEINQPLGAILRNAEAAELFLKCESPDLDEIRAILVDIRKDDQRAGSVIDRMRTFLRRQEMEMKPLDASELVGEVIALARPDAAARLVRLEVDVAEGLPQVRGERVHLQQVLLNLILNAMDALHASPTGDRRVLARVQLQDPETIQIAVSDTGEGIPAHKIAKVFEPFFTTKPNGMGMGLPISRTIIEAHGGRLWADNNDRGGCTFHFTLPTASNVSRT